MAGASLEISHGISIYVSRVLRQRNTYQYRTWNFKVKRPENLVTIRFTKPKLSYAKYKTAWIGIHVSVINFLFYQKCLPSYKIMQFTFQKTCYWSNKDDIFDVLHQSFMAPWTRQLIPADIWSQTLYSCDPRSRFLWVLDLGNWTGSLRPI